MKCSYCIWCTIPKWSSKGASILSKCRPSMPFAKKVRYFITKWEEISSLYALLTAYMSEFRQWSLSDGNKSMGRPSIDFCVRKAMFHNIRAIFICTDQIFQWMTKRVRMEVGKFEQTWLSMRFCEGKVQFHHVLQETGLPLQVMFIPRQICKGNPQNQHVKSENAQVERVAQFHHDLDQTFPLHVTGVKCSKEIDGELSVLI